ncbi:MAG: methionine--tRNA ligase, partial [Anaerolineae bacterium]|nr:methionine--tRNA ligase [Anaerolineae bacterium]
MPDKILIAVAWPYASGSRHLGHVSSFGVPSDVFARFMRMRGHDVLMVSGTDEHGTPITVRADQEGRTPRELVDYYSREIADNLRTLGCSYDLFTRTTTANHYAETQELFRRLLANGCLKTATAIGTYCPRDRRFLPDRYVEGTCPHCGYDSARGDQCDTCGRQLDPADLVGPRCRVCGGPPEFRPTEHFFLDLPAFAARLRAWAERQAHWRPNVRHFTLGLLDEGLQPRAITRDLEWGVPIPVPGYEDKRIYVWFDAVIGYLSAPKEWARHVAGHPDLWESWWRNPDARHYYFMGKDNIVFHSVIWPAMLMGSYPDHGLPYDIVSAEFLTMEGKRFSTSRHYAIWLPDVLSRYDPDPLRYCLIAGGPETADTDFTWAEFVRRNNDELVATWGNLAHRLLTFTYKHFGAVPEPGELDEVDRGLLATAAAGFQSVGEQLEACHFKAALAQTMAIAQAANRYLDQRAPWLAIREDRARAATSLYVALQAVDQLKLLLCPFLPHTCQQLHRYLGYEGDIAGPLFFREIDEPGTGRHRVLTCQPKDWIGRWQPTHLPPGQPLREPKPLYKKLDDRIVDEE